MPGRERAVVLSVLAGVSTTFLGGGSRRVSTFSMLSDSHPGRPFGDSVTATEGVTLSSEHRRDSDCRTAR